MTTPASPAEQAYFRIDIKVWDQILEGEPFYAQLAYLVLAAYSQRDNRTTFAGVKAIAEHTGMRRREADAALKRLLQCGVVSEKRSRGPWQRKLELVTWQEAAGRERPRKLGAHQEVVIRKLRRAEALDSTDQRALRALIRWGYVRAVPNDGSGATNQVEADQTVNTLALPKLLVNPSPPEATPPVALLRLDHDAGALRLLIRIYREQAGSGALVLPRTTVVKTHSCKAVATVDNLVVWAFDNGTHIGGFGEHEAHVKHLVTCGLLRWLCYITEADAPDAQVVLVLGADGCPPGSVEVRLAEAARRASQILLPADLVEQYRTSKLVALPRTLRNAQITTLLGVQFPAHAGQQADLAQEDRRRNERWLKQYEDIWQSKLAQKAVRDEEKKKHRWATY
jgi:hypothetical protein